MLLTGEKADLLEAPVSLLGFRTTLVISHGRIDTHGVVPVCTAQFERVAFTFESLSFLHIYCSNFLADGSEAC